MSSEPAENKAPHSPARSPNYYNNNKAIKTTTLKKLAIKLYDLGFNVVPVDINKKPLTSWSTRQRITRKQLLQLLNSASGVAIVGGPENPWKPTAVIAIIDVDNPRVLEDNPSIKSVVELTVSWYTGPRCPSCGSKQARKRGGENVFKCEVCGAEFTLKEARRGIGALITVDPDVAERYLKGTIRGKDVEILINNYALIPPSQHPSGIRYEWIRQFDWDAPDLGVKALVEGELIEILKELGVLKKEAEIQEEIKEKERQEAKEEREAKHAVRRELRELNDAEILEVKNLLKEAYRPGNRQYIWLFLSGWAAKAGISPISTTKVLKMLYDETQDSDPLKTRAGAIIYSYKKAGIDVDKWGDTLESILGIKPYGLEREIKEEDVKGRSGLQEILEHAVGEERSLEIIRRIEEIFGVASPYRDSIIEILDYEKQLYAVANLRKLVVVRARQGEDRLIYKERVTVGAPTEVTVYVNPIGGITKYQVKWEALTRPRPLMIGPAPIEDIVSRLRAEGLILNHRLGEDVIAAIVEGFVRKGRALIKEEIEAPGFYLVDGKVVAVGYEVKEPSKEELRQALELLSELGEWYKHAQDKFATVIKWGVVAPFGYMLKQRGRWIKWLYLYGSSRTGKTTLGEIVLAIWGLDTRYIKTGASVDTPARLGYVLSQSTFPTLVNEPGGALAREDIVEIIKSSVESTLARGKYMHGSYTEIPALAPLVFTSNKYLPRDDALLRRLIVLKFTFSERIPEERAREFESKVRPRLHLLRYLGQYVASRLVASPDLNMEWEDLAERLLEEAYAQVGLQLPGWVKLKHKEEDNVYDDIREAIRAFLVRRVNEEYNRFVGRVMVETTDSEELREDIKARQEIGFAERCRIVLENKLLPWAALKNGVVYFLTPLAEELQPLIGDIGGLKSIAELMGWEYKVVKVAGKATRVATTSLTTLIELLSGEIEDNQN